MMHGTPKVPTPHNEPVLPYAPGTPERAAVKAELERMSGEVIDIPMVIGGEEVRTGKTSDVVMPHAKASVIGKFHFGEPSHTEKAIEAAMAARAGWTEMPFRERAAILLRAAELLATRWRPVMNASTMLGQSKTVHQAEIDAACELIDFFRFNVAYAEQLHADQPLSTQSFWDMVDYRGLDGFVFAVTPFNFTSIAANLVTAPALMGNTVVWKPSLLSMHSAWQIMGLLHEAGMPPGVINLVTGDPAAVASAALSHRDFAGLHFTGSTAVLRGLFRTVGENLERYRTYPRIVGESGGKDFVFAHPSAVDDIEGLAVAIVRGGFEFQGQKCSAASRVYVPESVWKHLEPRLLALIEEIRMGDVSDFRNFMGAVIGEAAFGRIASYLEEAKRSSEMTILAGGNADDSVGYFVEPTLIRTTNPRVRPMCEEIFGPVVTLYVYPDAEYEKTLEECDAATEYGLTGAIFARERDAIQTALRKLRGAAGNFYINDKPTGAVVGQQPFGGSRASGTNDKAGSILNLIRWTSPRTVKETFVPPRSVGYPFMAEE